MKITIEDKIYPQKLREISNPPKQLYVKGNIELLKSTGIAVIGSRNCTEYGKRMTQKFTKELSRYTLTIISGMALGIDSIAHKEALKYGTNTIAVLPSGFSKIYPKQNKQLYKEIIENKGLVVTEYKEDEEVNSKYFIERNRIVSGLSIGVLVVEGGYRSGTGVTARLAKEQGKEVFCIPSSLDNSKGITPNKLIKKGAKLVTSCEDIVENYSDLNLKKTEEEEIVEAVIPKELLGIYKLIKSHEQMNINDIVKSSKLSIEDVNYKLMMLELDEKIEAIPGKNFKVK